MRYRMQTPQSQGLRQAEGVSGAFLLQSAKYAQSLVQMNGIGDRAGFCAALLAILGGAGAQQYQH